LAVSLNFFPVLETPLTKSKLIKDPKGAEEGLAENLELGLIADYILLLPKNEAFVFDWLVAVWGRVRFRSY